MKNILVTGGAGYIGAHTCEQLKKRGYFPVVVDDLSRGYGDFVQFGPLVKFNLRETPRIVRTLKEYNIQSVLHFAAFALVEESVKFPLIVYENNVSGTLSLLKACEEAGVENFVFSSSCAVYGNPTSLPVEETERLLPVSPYGFSKLMCEQMIEDFSRVSPLRFAHLRYFNVAGASSSGSIGESHIPETHLIPLLLQSLDQFTSPFSIFGDDFPTPDGTCVRDFIHVQDLARAHVLALEGLQTQRFKNEKINLGSGRGFSVREVLQTVEKVTGKTISAQVTSRRPGDPAFLVASTKKAQSLLGFKPEFNLEAMIESAWNWHKKKKKG